MDSLLNAIFALLVGVFAILGINWGWRLFALMQLWHMPAAFRDGRVGIGIIGGPTLTHITGVPALVINLAWLVLMLVLLIAPAVFTGQSL